MKQYCRYCSHCSYGDIVYCKLLKKTMSEDKAKKLQKCKYFEFCEIDVFNPDHRYKARQKKQKGQMNIFEIEELENENQNKTN